MKMKRNFMTIGFLLTVYPVLLAQSQKFDGLAVSMDNLYRLSDAKTRSISPENFTGEKGKGGMATLEEGSAAHAAKDLGQGWKVNPYVHIKPGETLTMAEIDGPGAIQHIWLTGGGNRRFSILRMYWDDEEEPSVECPLGDFFANGWGEYAHIQSLAVCVNPGSACNSYWVMPFRKKCRVTLSNISDKQITLYYQIDYVLSDVPDDAAYFHAQFRRVNPLKYKDVYTIIDGIKGKGQYVGTYMCWGVNNNGWWGEGEIKFFMDGDKKFPTINGTGTEDYFCGSYNFHARKSNTNYHESDGYEAYTTPYAGLAQVIRPDGLYNSQMRFGLYRWHITDPVRFEKDLRITIQALGWRDGGRYLPLKDDIASVAYWYQTEPHNPFPKLPSKDELEIN